MSITVKQVSKSFGSFRALEHVSVEVAGGSLVALLGPSGSGKTTLLRIIAGLEVADSGTVLYEDEDVTDAAVKDRNVGFVFQHYALFRHMTVFENVAFGLRVRRWPRKRVKERVGELLRLIQLDGLAGSYPSQLSGGQRQRVALARALAPEPKVLLLDEPFGALDAKVRQDLRQWLRRLHDEIHVTSVFVTHDQEEAFEVADRVVIMNHGHVEQTGTSRGTATRSSGSRWATRCTSRRATCASTCRTTSSEEDRGHFQATNSPAQSASRNCRKGTIDIASTRRRRGSRQTQR